MVVRLAIVASHPIQYYAPWFRLLAQEPGLEIRVFYLHSPEVTNHSDAGFGKAVQWDVDLLSGYNHEFVPNQSSTPSPDTFDGLHNPGLPKRLAVFSPHATLIYGYAFQTHLRLIMRRGLGLWRTPLIFRGDSHLLDGPSPTFAKRSILKLLYRQFDAFLPVGSANVDYFRFFGVPERKLFVAPHAVDSEQFQITPERQNNAAAERRRLGIPPEARVFLFSGKFTAKKRPDLLLSTFIKAAPTEAHLVLAGDGALDAQLKETAAGHPRVHFLAFANQQSMPSRYLLGDVFVLPSQGRYETWGLAVNEAMHLRRPCLVSDLVGCQRDLVAHHETGWVFPANDDKTLAKLIKEIALCSHETMRLISANAATRVAQFNYAATTAGLRRALTAILPA